MINFDDYINENKTEHNKNQPYTPNKLYKILIIDGSGSGKTNVLLNLIQNKPGIDKIYLYAIDPYQYLIDKREGVGIDHFSDPKVFIEYSNDMHDVYKNVSYYNPDKEFKILIVFVDMIADMINNKKLNSIVNELFIRSRKLKISLVFIALPCFKALNTTHFLIPKIPNRRELQETMRNHSSAIKTEDFTNIYRKCTVEPYSFSVNDTMIHLHQIIL